MFPRLTIIQFVLIRIHPSINCIKFTLIHLKTSMFIVQYFPLILTWHHHLHCVGWHGKYSSYDFKVNNDINYICSKILVCVCVCDRKCCQNITDSYFWVMRSIKCLFSTSFKFSEVYTSCINNL
jgi:hypothetical protein